MAMVVERLSMEIIKPSSPTPPHKQSFKFSLFDQLAPPMYTPLLLFYPAPQGRDNSDQKATENSSRSLRLKASLSETLTLLYPLAGRVLRNASIHCNDQGVPFVEAYLSCHLTEILKDPQVHLLRKLLPIEIESSESGNGPLLLVRINTFKCGGMTIGICASHKIADASTMCTLVKVWGATACGFGQQVMVPEFPGAILFPQSDLLNFLPTINVRLDESVTKKFVFKAPSIAALKAEGIEKGAKQLPLTRVEAVSALIWNCAMAASRSNLSRNRPSILTQTVNIRRRLDPPLPENSVGNYVTFFAAEIDEREAELPDLMDRLRKGSKEFNDNYLEKLRGKDRCSVILGSYKESGKLFSRNDIDLYNISSWCRFPLYDAADFGWGKPTWVSVANSPFKNVAVLMDTKDGGGIEAWVTLKEEDMLLFEQDQYLLKFASLNPCVLDSFQGEL